MSMTASKTFRSATDALMWTRRPCAVPLRVLSASGQLGYGIPQASFERGMARQPHVIGCDMGSIDPVPYYLGSGKMAAPLFTVCRDLELVLLLALNARAPLIAGSAGVAGTRPQLDATVALVREITERHLLSLGLATVSSDVSGVQAVKAMRAGLLQSIGPTPQPNEARVLACTPTVGQCGVETFKRALESRPDVLIAGRACDTAIFVTLPEILEYFEPRSVPTLKIEGAAFVGARAVLLAGIADPNLLQALQQVEARVRQLIQGAWTVHPHVYGQGAVRPLPTVNQGSHEAGLVLEFIAPGAGQALAVAGVFKQNLLHYSFPGWVCAAGNLVFAFALSERYAHDTYRFVPYHVMQEAPMLDIFKVTILEIGA